MNGVLMKRYQDQINNLLDSYQSYEDINKLNVRTVILDGGGHFFRDLYLEDVIDIIIE